MPACSPLKYGSPMPLPPEQVAPCDESSQLYAYPELRTPRFVPSRGLMTLPKAGKSACCPAAGACVLLYPCVYVAETRPHVFPDAIWQMPMALAKSPAGPLTVSPESQGPGGIDVPLQSRSHMLFGRFTLPGLHGGHMPLASCPDVPESPKLPMMPPLLPLLVPPLPLLLPDPPELPLLEPPLELLALPKPEFPDVPLHAP